jgi:hypothetical protein
VRAIGVMEQWYRSVGWRAKGRVAAGEWDETGRGGEGASGRTEALNRGPTCREGSQRPNPRPSSPSATHDPNREPSSPNDRPQALPTGRASVRPLSPSPLTFSPQAKIGVNLAGPCCVSMSAGSPRPSWNVPVILAKGIDRCSTRQYLSRDFTVGPCGPRCVVFSGARPPYRLGLGSIRRRSPPYRSGLGSLRFAQEAI